MALYIIVGEKCKILLDIMLCLWDNGHKEVGNEANNRLFGGYRTGGS